MAVEGWEAMKNRTMHTAFFRNLSWNFFKITISNSERVASTSRCLHLQPRNSSSGHCISGELVPPNLWIISSEVGFWLPGSLTWMPPPKPTSPSSNSKSWSKRRLLTNLANLPRRTHDIYVAKHEWIIMRFANELQKNTSISYGVYCILYTVYVYICFCI